MPQVFSSETIVAKLRRGEDVDGVTRYLYKMYERPLLNYIRKLGCSPPDEDDIIQEVMLTFLYQVQQGNFEQRVDADLRSYLMGIAHRKFLKKMEGETRRKKRQYQFLLDYNEPETPETLAIKSDFQAWAWQRFQQLDTVCQQILTAFYRDGKSLEEIAQQYEISSVGAVKMRKSRCLQKLLTDLNI